MLPRGYFENEDTLTFERWVNQNAHLIYRLDISDKAFTDYGFTWPCSVMIYSISYTRDEPIHHSIDKIDEQTLLNEVKALHTSPHFTVISDAINYIKRRGSTPVFLKPAVDFEFVESAPKLTLPIHGTNKVKISLSPDSSRLNITVDNLLTALKIDQYKKDMGEAYNEGLRENTKEADVKFRRRNILEKPDVIVELAESLYEMNLEPQIDKQVINWHMKRVRWLERQQTPFEQFILKDGEWVCLHEDDGIKSMYPEMHQARLKQLDDIGISKWLWEFQREDIARMSLKDTNLMCWEMGLGKCVLPDSTVYINGTLMPIEDVWNTYHTDVNFDGEGYWSLPKEPLYTNSINKDGQIVESQIELLYKQEINENIKTITLADGTSISSTLAHKFLNADGWDNNIGNIVCTPSHILQHGNKTMDKNIVSFIGWQIAESYERDRTKHKYSYDVTITQKDINVLYDLKEKFKSFNLDIVPTIITPKDGRCPHLDIHRKEFVEHLVALGYGWGLLSAKRFIPKFIQELNNDCLSTFIQSFFDGEGSVIFSMRSIEISSASETLMHQLAMLLRRFGIWMRISMKMRCATNGKNIKRPYWIGTIGGNGLRLYKQYIGFSIKYKQDMLEKICNFEANTNIEGVPASKIVKELVDRTGLSHRMLGTNWVYTKGTQEFSKKSLQSVITAIDNILNGKTYEKVSNDPSRRKKYLPLIKNVDVDYIKSVQNKLSELVNREVFYTKVKSVEYSDYKGAVYDLTVKDHHNFIANGCLCHNTRGIIAMGLMYGVKHSLIVVEPKLKDEFIKEFKNIGIPETDYQIILEERQLKHLRKFNIIAYNLLWRPLNEHTKKTFAKAMRRRFQFIAIDEAHKIKAKDSQQAKAVRMLKARYKLLSTGTPIANYPRNIFSLLVFGWGDGTERNPYGYYSPVEKDNGYGYTTGTRKFKEDYISIAWVTPQFEQTLDSGAKSREIPKIKDPLKWWEMMAPKILRRQRDEPDVSKIITFPKPVISTELIKMDDAHLMYYRHWMDNFATWFKNQLRMEKEEGHKIDQMVILAHLTQLQFASTIPQSPKTAIEGNPWKFGLTTKQMRVLELIKEAIANDEKIIV
ncbi:MAG: SNF2-related protein, partial [Candidatus Desantisbacteria bacterium]